jgi:hypothetical protein
MTTKLSRPSIAALYSTADSAQRAKAAFYVATWPELAFYEDVELNDEQIAAFAAADARDAAFEALVDADLTSRN